MTPLTPHEIELKKHMESAIRLVQRAAPGTLKIDLIRYAENPNKRIQASDTLLYTAIESIAHNAISLNEMARRAGIMPQILTDAQASRQKLSVTECESLIAEAQKLRQKIKKASRSWAGVLDLLYDPRIKAKTLVGGGSLYERLAVAWKGGKSNFTSEEEEKVREKLLSI